MKKPFLLFAILWTFIAGSSALAWNYYHQTPPLPPTHVRGYIEEPDYIWVRWAPPQDGSQISVYRVYRNTELVATTYKTLFVDMEYDRDVLNTYWVTSVDREGNESGRSDVLSDPRQGWRRR